MSNEGHNVAIAVRTTRYDHGDPGPIDHCRPDRAQQHASEPAAAVAADHNQLSEFRCLEQRACRIANLDSATDPYVGIAFVPTRKSFSKRLLLVG